MKQYTVRLPEDLAAFLERKRNELKRNTQLAGCETYVTYSSLLQSMVSFWRAMDSGEDINERK